MMQPTSEAEVVAFERWLDADPDHARVYADMQSVSSMGERLPRRLLSEPSTSPPWRLRPAFGVAAMVAFLLIAGLWLTSSASPPAYAAISNPDPSVRGIRLSDGSEVILDTGAKLAVLMNGNARNIRIEAGRARFTIASDPYRPFSVAASTATVTAGDAIFDIAVEGGEARIHVLKGDLVVSTSNNRASKSMSVQSGQAVSIQPGRVSGTTVQPGQAHWPSSRLGFEDTPIGSIVTIANRGDGPDIAFQDQAIGALEVTGVIDIRDTRTLARKLAASHGLRVEETGRTLMIVR